MRTVLAIAFVTSLVAATESRAQAVDAPHSKDPQTALLFSIIVPGGGQIYSGETGRGWLMLAVAEGALVAGYATSQRGECKHDDCTGPHWDNLYIGAGVSLATWIVSMVDAPNAARRYNAKHSVTRMQAIASPDRIGVAVTF